MLSINNRPQMYLDKGLCCMFWYTYLDHTVSSQDFRSFSFSVISVGDFQHCISTCSGFFFREIAMSI